MKIRAAVLEEIGLASPYAASLPLKVQEVDLAGPGPGEVLVKMAVANRSSIIAAFLPSLNLRPCRGAPSSRSIAIYRSILPGSLAVPSSPGQVPSLIRAP